MTQEEVNLPQKENISPFRLVISKLKVSLHSGQNQEKTIVVLTGSLLTLLLIIIALGLNLHNNLDQTEPQPIPPLNGRPIVLPESDVVMVAEDADSMGVSGNTTFLLTAKDPIDAGTITSQLQVTPIFSFSTEQVGDSSVRIRPLENLPDNTIVQLSLSDGEVLGERTGAPLDWAFQTKPVFKVLSSIPRTEVAGVPLDSGIEFVFTTDLYEDIAPYLRIDPPVELKYERHKDTAVAYPKDLLAEATLYTVTLSGDLGVSGGAATLGEDYVIKFETAKSSESVEDKFNFGFAKQFTEIPVSEKPVMEVFAYEDKEQEVVFDVSVFQYSTLQDFITELTNRREIPIWAQATWDSYQSDRQKLQNAGSFKVTLQWGEYSGFLELPVALTKGQYLVVAEHGGTVDEILLQISDISAYITTSETDTLLWVRNNTTGQPVNGYKVEHVAAGTVGTTNEQGVATFATPQSITNNTGTDYFLITGANDSLVMPANRVFSPYYYGYYRDDYWYWGGYADGSYYSYLYNDRLLYQPDDTIRVWGIVKNRDDLSQRPKVEIRLTNGYSGYGDRALLVRRDLSLSSFGGFTEDIPIVNLPEGSYNIELLVEDMILETSWVRVERYEKPIYKLSLDSQKKAIFAGDQVSFDGGISLYEGSAVGDFDLNYSGSVNGSVVSDKDGRFSIGLQGVASNYWIYGTNNIDIRPSDSELAETIAGGQVYVFGSSVDLDGEVTYTGNDKASIQVTTYNVSLDEINSGGDFNYRSGVRSNQDVNSTITEVEYKKVETGEYYDFINKRMQKTYRYDRLTKPHATFSLTSDRNGLIRYDFSMNEDRSYEIKIETTDPQGRLYRIDRYAQYGGRKWFPYFDDNKYSLVYDESVESYSVGDRIDVAVYKGSTQLPSAEMSDYLFLSYHRGLRDYTVQNTSGFSTRFSNEYVPTVYLRGVFFDGRTFFNTSMQVFTFDRQDRNLTIEVEPNKREYSPGETVDLTVSTLKNGIPTSAEVNVSVVDEAMFVLSYNPEVDLLGALYQNIASGEIQMYSSHQYPRDEAAGEMGASCFLEGTKVLMGDGTYQEIENIVPGDTIATLANPYKKGLVQGTVSKVFRHDAQNILLINNELWVTPEHRFFYKGRWQPIGDAHIGDELIDEQGNPVSIVSMEYVKGDFRVYNLRVETYHTYIAGGYYVHNDKGRDNFVDTAYFGTVSTNAQGNGSASFVIPDNMTSWRVTYQGVTNDLYAGSGKTNISATLPMFIELSVGKEFLLDDKPFVSAKIYGDQVESGANVAVTYTLPTLGINEPVEQQVKAGDTLWIELPELTIGQHYISVLASVGGLQDKVTRYFNVIRSRIEVPQTAYYSLDESFRVEDPDTVSYIVLSDNNRGKYISSVNVLGWNFGNRIDQRIGHYKQQQLMSLYFNGDVVTDEAMNIGTYQLPSGGVSLLPYSSEEIELSAKVTAVAVDELNRDQLRVYFRSVLAQADVTIAEAAPALYGLALLGEPVLLDLQDMAKEVNIDTRSFIYVGLGLAELGDGGSAWGVYKTVLEQYGEEALPYVRVTIGEDIDDIVGHTIAMAQLGAKLRDDKAENMFFYVQNTHKTDILTVLEEIDYLQTILPILPAEKVAFSYSYGDLSESIQLDYGQLHNIKLTPSLFSQLTFSNVSGNVGVAITRNLPLALLGDISESNNFSFNRQYEKTAITDGDLVQVIIDYSFDKRRSYDGCYEVIDYVPSGLRPVTRPYRYGRDDSGEYVTPHRVEGQTVSFCAYNPSKVPYRPLMYYARTASIGEYVAEEVLMQSTQARTELRFGETETIRINR